MDGVRATRRLSALLLLGAIGLCGLVLASLSPSRAGRAGPSWSTGVGAGAVIEAGAAEPDRKSAASAAGAPPDWQLVAKTPGGARAHTAAELTAALVAEYLKDDPRGLHHANIGALRTLLLQKDEAEILGAAAALLDCGTEPAADAASRLAGDVLGRKGRKTTDDEAFAILGNAASRILEAPPGGADSPRIRLVAATTLASIGTPEATEVLLRTAKLGSEEFLAWVRNPASVPLLSEALLSRRYPEPTVIAIGLSSTPEGRAELRRILDPAGGLNWTQHADAKVATLRAMATAFREADDLRALDAALRERPDVASLVTGAMARHGAAADARSTANLMLPLKSDQARAIVAFLADREGSAIEPSLLAILGRFPERIVDPLLPRLEAARPGMRDRVVAARTPAK